MFGQKILGQKKFGLKTLGPKKYRVHKNLGLRKLGQKEFWSEKIKAPKKFGQIWVRNYSWYGKNLSKQILPVQMSPWHLESVKDGHRNLPLKFGQNRVSISWDIPDMDKCRQDK